MEVHHQVRKALTSTERIEVLAAVAALDRLTAASPRPAHGVLPTVLSSLHGMDLALDAKCRLAAVLAHMRHTPELAQAAHAGGTEVCTPLQHPVRLYWAEQCEPHFVWVFWVFRRSTEGVGCARSQLLLLHPPRELAAAVLTALTRLACSSLVTVPAQVTLSLGTHATDQATPCRSGRKDIVNARPGSVGREKCAGHRFIVSISAAHSQSLSVASLSPQVFSHPHSPAPSASPSVTQLSWGWDATRRWSCWAAWPRTTLVAVCARPRCNRCCCWWSARRTSHRPRRCVSCTAWRRRRCTRRTHRPPHPRWRSPSCTGANPPSLRTRSSRVWKAASSKADPRQQQDRFLNCLQGGRVHPLAACGVPLFCCSPPALLETCNPCLRGWSSTRVKG